MAVHYYPLINKIISHLKIRDSLINSFALSPETSFVRPFITIAREPGSGGAPIARAVAEKLGFEFVDEQIVQEIARSTKKRKAIIEAVDEKNRSAIEDMVHSMLNKEYIDDMKYMKELIKILLTYASQGQCVILGRGANFITPFAKGLHVSVTAPYKVRVQRAMDFEGHNEEKAKEVIAQVEKERDKFIKQYFRQDPNKKNAFDITLNTTYFKVDEAADVIVEAFYKKFSRSVRYGAIFKRS
ncbi:MAG TPA: cytidylate kinase-like family protein [Patescibacteria group bacterium]